MKVRRSCLGESWSVCGRVLFINSLIGGQSASDATDSSGRAGRGRDPIVLGHTVLSHRVHAAFGSCELKTTRSLDSPLVEYVGGVHSGHCPSPDVFFLRLCNPESYVPRPVGSVLAVGPRRQQKSTGRLNVRYVGCGICVRDLVVAVSRDWM